MRSLKKSMFLVLCATVVLTQILIEYYRRVSIISEMCESQSTKRLSPLHGKFHRVSTTPGIGRSTSQSKKRRLPKQTTRRILHEDALPKHMSDLAISLHKAQIHVRGTKTSTHLRHAIETFDKVLSSFNFKPDIRVNRKVFESQSVCPETFMGAEFDFPLFNIGFEVTNCSYAKPISHLVTIVAYIEEDDSGKANKIATDFADSVLKKTNINALMAVKFNFTQLKQFRGKVKYIYAKDTNTRGFYWNKMISEVKTPYVLIARDVDVLTNDSRLERLVREIERLQVSVAAGSVRYRNGYWDKGCYQSVHRNFTLRYLKGFDESLHDCLFCDYVQGPFVASVDTLRSIPFSEIEMESGLFEDWFLQLSKKGNETVVCPDSMFHVSHKNQSVEGREPQWSAFMKKWDLYKVMPSTGKPILSKCQSIRYRKKHSTIALHPCRLGTLSYATNTITDESDKAGIICELDAGTLIGAVKLGYVLPWELDADLVIPAENNTDFEKLKDRLSKHGLKLSQKTPKSLGFDIRYKDWRVEADSIIKTHTKIALVLGKIPTRVLVGGRWTLAPRNPALSARNRYGPEIYKHDFHTGTRKRKGESEQFKPGKFLSCDDPKAHGCLDRYNGDGIIQFMDPLP